MNPRSPLSSGFTHIGVVDFLQQELHVAARGVHSAVTGEGPSYTLLRRGGRRVDDFAQVLEVASDGGLTMPIARTVELQGDAMCDAYSMIHRRLGGTLGAVLVHHNAVES